jgi:mono/diheme cytochrome c family protein
LLILFSAATAFLGALALNGLPLFENPVFSNARFRRVTDDKFFISISSADPAFDAARTRELLESLDRVAVVEPFYSSLPAKIPKAFHVVGAFAVCLACFPPLLIAYARATKSTAPRIHVWPDMDSQAKFKTQTLNPQFADRRTMRPPVEGTVAVGRLYEDSSLIDGKESDQFVRRIPLAATTALMERGRERFEIFCAPCHGFSGEGDGIVAQRAMAREEPWIRRSLIDDYAQKLPVGSIYNTIRYGKNTMLPYGSQIPPEDRWAIVLYVKALQRSQNATIDDVPEEFRAQLQ